MNNISGVYSLERDSILRSLVHDFTGVPQQLIFLLPSVFIFLFLSPWIFLVVYCALWLLLVLAIKLGQIALLPLALVAVITIFTYSRIRPWANKVLSHFKSACFVTPSATIVSLFTVVTGLGLGATSVKIFVLDKVISPPNYYNQGVVPKGVSLSKANLRSADLSAQIFTGADLTGTDLTGANLGRARLRGATLRKATLANAYLVEANLLDADLEGANLEGADLRLAKFCNTRMPDGKIRNSECWYRNRAAGEGTSCSKTLFWWLCPYLP